MESEKPTQKKAAPLDEDFQSKAQEREALIERIIHPVEQLIRNRPISGILLFSSVALALIWANSSFKESYHHLWEIPFSLSIGDYSLSRTLHYWINEGLMAIFFFVIGLEIKREIYQGQLSSLKKASLPIAAAIGGMLVPAVIFIIFNKGGAGESGWGVPMATDIAFALGILSLLGKKVPTSIKIFLTALAIVDDLGAVLVIALFYTNNLLLNYLELGAFFFLILGIGNLVGIRKTAFYSIFGICGLWVAFLHSGVHATLAGVIVAMTIPSKSKINEGKLIMQFNLLLTKFKNTKMVRGFYVSPKQGKIIEEMKATSEKAESPLQKLEHALSPFVSYFIIPLFALVNSGIEIDGELWSSMGSAVPMGIMIGLLLGKVVGISFFSFIMVKSGLAELPSNTNWGLMIGAGILGGIGFTMSIFISELAFETEILRTQAKMAVMLASTLAAIIGLSVIRLFGNNIS